MQQLIALLLIILSFLSNTSFSILQLCQTEPACECYVGNCTSNCQSGSACQMNCSTKGTCYQSCEMGGYCYLNCKEPNSISCDQDCITGYCAMDCEGVNCSVTCEGSYCKYCNGPQCASLYPECTCAQPNCIGSNCNYTCTVKTCKLSGRFTMEVSEPLPFPGPSGPTPVTPKPGSAPIPGPSTNPSLAPTPNPSPAPIPGPSTNPSLAPTPSPIPAPTPSPSPIPQRPPPLSPSPASPNPGIPEPLVTVDDFLNIENPLVINSHFHISDNATVIVESSSSLTVIGDLILDGNLTVFLQSDNTPLIINGCLKSNQSINILIPTNNHQTYSVLSQDLNCSLPSLNVLNNPMGPTCSETTSETNHNKMTILLKFYDDCSPKITFIQYIILGVVLGVILIVLVTAGYFAYKKWDSRRKLFESIEKKHSEINYSERY